MQLRIVTLNARVDTPHDGVMRFEFRKGRILSKISQERPDLIGFQETTWEMASFFKEYLPDYIFVGNGREADYSGENNMIGFLRSRFELLELSTRWLSDTPYIPGSRYEKQSICPRIVTHALLRPLDGGEPFHHYNTHLDHVSEEARVLGAQALMAQIRHDQQFHPFAVLLTGDMNDAPDSAPIRVFKEDDAFPLVDLTDGIPNSFHDFGRRPEEPRIDYIFARGFEAGGKPFLWDDVLEGIPLSDHHALEISVKI